MKSFLVENKILKSGSTGLLCEYFVSHNVIVTLLQQFRFSELEHVRKKTNLVRYYGVTTY